MNIIDKNCPCLEVNCSDKKDSCEIISTCINKELSNVLFNQPSALSFFCSAVNKCVDAQFEKIASGLPSAYNFYNLALEKTLKSYANYDESESQVLFSDNGVLTWESSTASTYTDEQAQDAVGGILSSEFNYSDIANQISINHVAWTKITGAPTFENTLTFSNGLSRSVNSVKLGGTLTQTTGLVQGGFDFYFYDGNVGFRNVDPSKTITVGNDSNGNDVGYISGPTATNFLIESIPGAMLSLNGGGNIRMTPVSGSGQLVIDDNTTYVNAGFYNFAGTKLGEIGIDLLGGGIDEFYLRGSNGSEIVLYDKLRLANIPQDNTSTKVITIDSNDRVRFRDSSSLLTMLPIGNSPNANAATISNATLTIQPASTSFGGVVTTDVQTFSGNKTFNITQAVGAFRVREPILGIDILSVDGNVVNQQRVNALRLKSQNFSTDAQPGTFISGGFLSFLTNNAAAPARSYIQSYQQPLKMLRQYPSVGFIGGEDDWSGLVLDNDTQNGPFTWKNGTGYKPLRIKFTDISDNISDEIFAVDADGTITTASIPHATVDTDKFLVNNLGTIKYRTGVELLSDIGLGTGSATNGQVLTVINNITGEVGWTTVSGGGGSGGVNAGVANRLAYYPSNGSIVDDLAAITANRALISDGNGLPIASSVTNVEIGYVSGVTGAIQSQLNGKVNNTGNEDIGGIKNFTAAINNFVGAEFSAGVLVGGTSIAASAALEVRSTTKGLLLPRLTDAQKTALSGPTAGLFIYQSDGTPGLYYYTGSTWQLVSTGGGGGGGSVDSVSGTTNRITSTGGTDPVIDISAAYVGQSSITTVGTLTGGATGAGFTVALSTATITGTLLPARGGSGVSNTGTFTWGANNITLTTAGVTSVTIPTTGTLATLAGAESLTNKKLGSLITNGFVKTSAGDGTLSVDTSTYLTANQAITITGDATGSGTTSIALTLATVNGNVGSIGSSTAIPSFTVNAKGLITAASTNAVIAPAGTLTGTILAANVITSSLTAVGTLVTGVWNATTILPGVGGTGQSTYTNGQLLIGNSTGNTLTKATLTGTTNQVNVTNGTGSITLSLPQDIHIFATPQFSNLGLGGAAAGPAYTLNIVANATNSGIRNNVTLQADINGPGYGYYSSPRYLEASSGNHALFANIYLAQPNVTTGAATVTNTAQLYIEEVATTVVTGKNYAIWSDAGVNRFDGVFNVNGTDLTANQIWGANAAATAMEGKTITAGAGMAVTNGVGTVTVATSYLSTVQTLTDGATITWNVANGENAKVTLAGTGRTLSITNPQAGRSYTIEVSQDGTGSRTITTWPTGTTWVGGAPTLSTTAGAVDLIVLYYNGTAYRAVYNGPFA